MIEAFRLALRKHARPLSGKGAALSGGRWNSVGVELLYTASNRSLAMVEVVVHMPQATIPPDYVMLKIGIPDDVIIEELELESLPSVWYQTPYIVATQVLGDRFAAQSHFCGLRVPSAVTPGESNLLLNPKHSDFARIKILEIEDFRFDRRLVS